MNHDSTTQRVLIDELFAKLMVAAIDLEDSRSVHGMAFVEMAPALAAHVDRELAVSAHDLHLNGYANGIGAEALHAPRRDALACPPGAAEHS